MGQLHDPEIVIVLMQSAAITSRQVSQGGQYEEPARHEGNHASAESEAQAHDEPVKREILTTRKSGEMPRKRQSARQSAAREDSDARQSQETGVPGVPEGELELGDFWESDGDQVRRASALTRKSRRS